MPDYHKKIDKLVEKWQKGQFKNKMKKWEKKMKKLHTCQSELGYLN